MHSRTIENSEAEAHRLAEDWMFCTSEEVRVYEGDTTLESLVLDDDDGYSIIVAGDLTIAGDLLNQASDYGHTLLVLGALRARNIIAGGASIKVEGEVYLENALYARGLGTMAARRLTAPAVIVDDYNLKLENCEGESSWENLLPFLLEDGRPDDAVLCRHLRRGLSPLGAVGELSLASAQAEGGYEVEHGELDVDLGSEEAFPLQICALSSLRVLRCKWNNYRYQPLPRDFASLRELRGFSLTAYAATLPSNFRELSNLERLSIAAKDSDLERIAQLPSLVELHLIGTNYEAASLEQAQRLEVLSIHAYATVNLSTLPKLRSLALSGKFQLTQSQLDTRLRGGESVPLHQRCPVPLEVLDKVAELGSLEELHLFDWASARKNRHQKSSQRHIGGRPELVLPDAIGRLKSLRRLVISRSKIHSLPDSFFGLPALETITISGHCFSEEVVARMHAAFPEAHIELNT